MARSSPLLRLGVLRLAAIASLFFALCGEWDRLVPRAGDSGRSDERPLGHDLALWPDPVREAERRAWTLLNKEEASSSRKHAALKEAISLWPRSGALHLYLARWASAEGERERALAEIRLARRCDPFHAQIQAEAARAFLKEAVRLDDEELLEESAEAFAIAVAMDGISFEEAIFALEAAGASPELFRRAAGRSPDRLRRLIAHQAERGRFEEALRLGRDLDALQSLPSREGVAYAHMRTAVAFRKSGDVAGAVDHFEIASQLAKSPELFALDFADCLLALGREKDGVAKLVQAAHYRELDPARIAGSLLEAKDPRAALRAVSLNPATRETPAVRLGALEAARQLGDRSLLEALDPGLARRGAP